MRSSASAQLRLVNEGLQPLELHNKESFLDLCQLLVSTAANSQINFNVRDFLLSGHRLSEKNVEEYVTLFKAKKPSVQLAAKRKSLNFQIDL